MTEAIVTLILTSALLLGSPGPAPLALAAAGAVFGVRRSLPFLMGILLGLAVAISGAALGLNVLFEAFPEAVFVMQLVGAAYLLFIAFKIATAPVISPGLETGEYAPTFVHGFVLNLMNPKAYAAFVAIFSQFLLPTVPKAWAFALTGVLCFLVALVVDVVWLCLGGLMRPLFTRPQSARVLRLLLAVLMLVSVAWVIWQ